MSKNGLTPSEFKKCSPTTLAAMNVTRLYMIALLDSTAPSKAATTKICSFKRNTKTL